MAEYITSAKLRRVAYAALHMSAQNAKAWWEYLYTDARGVESLVARSLLRSDMSPAMDGTRNSIHPETSRMAPPLQNSGRYVS
jgi:hypothetical protein